MKQKQDKLAPKVDVDAKEKAADHPTRDDVHEQREPSQERPGVVRQTNERRRTPR